MKVRKSVDHDKDTLVGEVKSMCGFVSREVGLHQEWWLLGKTNAVTSNVLPFFP